MQSKPTLDGLVRWWRTRQRAISWRRPSQTRALLDGFIGFVGITELDGTLIEANRAPLEAAGLIRADVIGRKLWDCSWWSWSPEVQSRVRDACRRAAQGETVRQDVEFRARDDCQLVFDLQVAPMRDRAGRIRYLIPSGSDVTARIAAERSRETADRLLRIIGDATPDLIYAKDRDSRMLFANPATLAVLGRDASEVLGRTTADWHRDAQQAEAVMANDRLVIETETAQVVEEHFTDPRTGGQRVFRSSKSPMREESGEVIGLVGLSTDITELRRTQEELGRLNDSLEERVAAEIASREAAQSALAHTQRLEAIGQLTGGIAHDFNNLLQIIVASLELVRPVPDRAPSDLEGDTAQPHETALKAARRGAELTRQLLGFARRQPLRPRVLNPRLALEAAAGLFRRTLGEQIEVSVKVEGEPWNILADPVQLESALLNLAVNARDAMSGGGRLVLEAFNAVLDEASGLAEGDIQPGAYVCICVSDSGEGMPADVVARAFEPFFTTKPLGRGSGLGLAQVFGFAKQSDGHVKIESEPGVGTTVRLYLPRDRDGAEEVDTPQPSDVPTGTETILVVEDNPAVQATVCAMLEQLGYRVLRANDAEAAQEVLRSVTPVHVLFTDVVMPGPVSSTELARFARSVSPEPAVLFTSGFMEGREARDGHPDARIHMLLKPYGIGDLARKMRSVIDNRPPQEFPDAAPSGATLVLIVEDEALIRMSASAMVEDLGYKVTEAASGTEALRLLDAEPAIGVVIADLGLPDMEGAALLAQIRTRRPEVKIVVSTGGDAGGHDAAAILPKPYGLAELRRVFASL